MKDRIILFIIKHKIENNKKEAYLNFLKNQPGYNENDPWGEENWG